MEKEYKATNYESDLTDSGKKSKNSFRTEIKVNIPKEQW